MKVSAATISRCLTRRGLVTPEPAKRPKSSCIRFAAELPNQCWQSDFTHYRLASGTDTEILTWLDDHSRYALSLTAHARVTGPAVLLAFRAACDQHGIPASTLTDNGMVFTTRLSGGRGGRNALEHELRRLGVKQKNGKPNHPQTQGKVERFRQTMKNWLRAQPRQPATLAELQAMLDSFADTCSTRRPHRSLPGRATPATAYAARPKAVPGDRAADTHDRVRTDRIDATGLVTLRHQGRLYHIGTGRPRAGTRVLLLVQDLHIRVINAGSGELIRELILDPDKRYQATGKPSGWPKKTPRPLRGFAVSSMSCDITEWQVLGSNQRRLSRRFYSTLLLPEARAADQRVRASRHESGPPPSAMRPWTPDSRALEIHGRARTGRVGAVMPTVQPRFLPLTCRFRMAARCRLRHQDLAQCPGCRRSRGCGPRGGSEGSSWGRRETSPP